MDHLKPLESFATSWIGWAVGIVIANVTNKGSTKIQHTEYRLTRF
jgi:hypothetical protein